MKLKKTITALAAAFALTIGGAASAAVAASYPPDLVGGPTTIAPGGSGVVTFDQFQPNEQVTFTLTGENGAGASLAALAVVNSTSTTKAADSAGVAAVTVTLPSNATGSYTLAAVGAVSGAAPSFVIGTGIAATGADVSPLLLWGAVGAVGLGVIALIAITAIRRSRRQELVDA